ncbi:Protein CBG14726 [Caenorhabditis briggsae]|uniref:Protein CBG14726 n=1 Tax=Caenorhabditis briggsae TaxID=6238 RepID=A8XKJ3_CAEBR|nr:Protein CBG14726 [Caenorhabditis briggsae]CAP33167.2 Protein CBG14726 [Caenorhabditis briggsae]
MPKKRLIALLIWILLAIGLTGWLIVESAKFRTLSELVSSIWKGPRKGALDAQFEKETFKDAPRVCAPCAGGNFILKRFLMQSFKFRQAMEWKEDEWKQTDCVNGMKEDTLDSVLMDCAQLNFLALLFGETVEYMGTRDGWTITYLYNRTSSEGADWIANDLSGKVGYRRSNDDMSDLNKAVLILLFMATFSAILTVLGWYLTTTFMKLSSHLARKRRHEQRRRALKKMGSFGNVDSRLYNDMDGSEELKVIYTVKEEKVTVKKEKKLITMEFANLGKPEEIIGCIPDNAEPKLEYEWRRLQKKSVKETQETPQKKTQKTQKIGVVKVDEKMERQWAEIENDVFGFPTQKKNFMRSMSSSPYGTLERKEKNRSIASFNTVEGPWRGAGIESVDLPYVLESDCEYAYFDWDDEPDDADNNENLEQTKIEENQSTIWARESGAVLARQVIENNAALRKQSDINNS